MDIHYFRHFIAVAEELHFGRAAQRLNMEQPPLSQSIKRLEAWMGLTLFDRSARGTALTKAGAALLGEARKAVQQFEQAVSAARAAGGSPREPLRIGFVTAGILRLLPAAIRAFNDQFIDTRINLLEASSGELLAAVQADRLDLALVHPPEQAPPGIVLEALKRDRTIAALPRTHKLASRTTLSIRDLAPEPLIFFPRAAAPDLHKRFMEFFRRKKIVPLIEQEARLTPTILSLVGAGLGYALVQQSARHLHFPDVVFRPVKDLAPDLVWVLALAWKPGIAPPSAQAFARSLRAASAL